MLPEDDKVVDEEDPYVKAVDLVFDLMNVNPEKQPESTLKEYVERATNIAINMHMVNEKEEAVAQALGAKWDLRDEDGELHSPSWYLESWQMARENYMVLLTVDIDGLTPVEADAHMGNLDDAHSEMELYAGYVDRLFGLLR